MVKKLYFLSILGILFTSNAYALQRYEFNEEFRIEGSISAKELNRIKIEGDRIKQVVGLSKDYVVEGDGLNGQMFIKASGDAKQPAIFSIITESGRTQDLRLTPKVIPSETVIIEGYMKGITRVGREVGIKHGKHSEIVEVIRKAAEVASSSLDSKLKQIEGLSGKLAANKKIEGYRVEIWDVTNVTPEEIKIDERGFAIGSGDVYATAVEKICLKPQEWTRVYVVRGR